MAAALCCEYDCNPRDISGTRLDELQQRLLKADATILARPLDQRTPDLARSATVSATSEMRFNDQEPGELVPLIAHAGNILWDWHPHLDSVEFFLKNDSEVEQDLSVSVYRTKREQKWKSPDDFHSYGWNDLRADAFYKITTVDVILPPRYEGWYGVAFPERVHTGEKDMASDDDRLLIALGKNENVRWAVVERLCEIAEMGEQRMERYYKGKLQLSSFSQSFL